MPIYKKLPRSKPKKPDEFISFFDRLYHKAYERGPFVIAVLAVVAIVGLGILFWRTYHEHRAEKISEKYYQATLKGKEEREEILRDIKKSNLYAPLGIWASLELADQASGEGACDQILSELKPYVGHGESAPLRSVIYLKVGGCLEDKKDWKGAENLYEQGRFDSKNLLKDWCSLHLARVKRDLGDSEGAKKILEEILAKDSEASAPVKDEARTALNLFPK
jgi:FimV-like protein